MQRVLLSVLSTRIEGALKTFDLAFEALTGNPPFPWQRALYQRFLQGEIPASCDVATGLGKTSVIPVWLLAVAAGAAMPRRLVYVVNRRTVVDQTTFEITRLKERSGAAGITETLAVSTLRGQLADNRAWSADPSQLAVICGTVDMIGSRLLFSGYGVGFRSRPLHAGFLGQDALLIHDEAHLEPAFQHLIEGIVREQQRSGDPWPMKIMALTATSRSSENSFGLTASDLLHPIVAKRVGARKQLHLHECDEKCLAETVVMRALRYVNSGVAVLVFLRRVDDVDAAVERLRKAGASVQQLTGTMRGLERDRLVDHDPIVRRFLPGAASENGSTVFLVCTSAGEVGVNLSGDHLVCDLSTFDSMAQRLGRVNRFGLRDDTDVHVLHPPADGFDESEPLDSARARTLGLLRALDGDASPAALGRLDKDSRIAAFAPTPRLLAIDEILLDAWSMTTVRGELPGRLPVAEYLHGEAPWEPPRTKVAWRDEVDLVVGELVEQYPPQDLLEDYPLKPHELLSDTTKRILDTLENIASRHPRASDVAVWVISPDGRVDAAHTLASIVARDRKRSELWLSEATLLLSPRACQPVDGRLSVMGLVEEAFSTADIADEWRNDAGDPMRRRLFGTDAPTGMRLVRRLRVAKVDTPEEEPESLVWSWYELPRGASDEGSRNGTRPVLLDGNRSGVSLLS